MKTRNRSTAISLPVTLTEAKAFYRVIGTDQDVEITRTLSLATEKAEQITNRQIVRATMEAFCDTFKSSFAIPKPPLVSVTKVEYIDVNDAIQPWTDYYIDDVIEPAVIYFNTVPADVRTEGANNVIITYECGYAEVPESIKYFVLNYGLTRFENREGEVIGTIVNDDIAENVKHLLDDYRIIPV